MGRIEFRERLNYACAEGGEFLNGKSGILENHGKTENVEIELLYCHSLKKKAISGIREQRRWQNHFKRQLSLYDNTEEILLALFSILQPVRSDA